MGSTPCADPAYLSVTWDLAYIFNKISGMHFFSICHSSVHNKIHKESADLVVRARPRASGRIFLPYPPVTPWSAKCALFPTGSHGCSKCAQNTTLEGPVFPNIAQQLISVRVLRIGAGAFA